MKRKFDPKDPWPPYPPVFPKLKDPAGFDEAQGYYAFMDSWNWCPDTRDAYEAGVQDVSNFVSEG